MRSFYFIKNISRINFPAHTNILQHFQRLFTSGSPTQRPVTFHFPLRKSRKNSGKVGEKVDFRGHSTRHPRPMSTPRPLENESPSGEVSGHNRKRTSAPFLTSLHLRRVPAHLDARGVRVLRRVLQKDSFRPPLHARLLLDPEGLFLSRIVRHLLFSFSPFHWDVCMIYFSSENEIRPPLSHPPVICI
ncbi:hypothetical protein NPIL_309381 [Nephila pilipes]|uniref:Uncharacterized protein n=1 Tax=Nephila pilipes TaxID=299642 RepID=A0A8X6U1P3_NEPPI|nr:hypothetical protein NPIL_309381 [Nephila pilipes]